MGGPKLLLSDPVLASAEVALPGQPEGQPEPNAAMVTVPIAIKLGPSHRKYLLTIRPDRTNAAAIIGVTPRRTLLQTR